MRDDSIALVTGGAGFIGSHLVERFARDGRRVRLFDIRPPAGDWLDQIDAKLVEIVTGDIRDPASVRTAMQDVEVVFHEAAISSVQRSIANPRETLEVNLTGTLNVLEAARDAGCRRVIFASSAAVYGDSPEPVKSESTPPRPLSPYAVSKLAGEQLCAVYTHLHGLEAVSLRYFNVFGPRQDPTSEYSGVIARFMEAIRTGNTPTIYGDGEQTRDFVYVGDVVEANLLAAEVEDVAGKVFNVGSGQATSINALLQAIALNGDGRIQASYRAARPGDIRDSIGDVARAREHLKFSPLVPLHQGLRNLAEANQARAASPPG
jgi:UDP-glucose 4-epimerase